jgi:hypothetical protein
MKEAFPWLKPVISNPVPGDRKQQKKRKPFQDREGQSISTFTPITAAI